MLERLLLGLRRLVGSNDRIDGCDRLGDNPTPTLDEEIPYHLLFGDVAGDPRAVEARRRGLEELAHGA